MNINSTISSLSSIHPNACLGNDLTIDSFSTIHENVEIGTGTWIGSNVTIMNGARIGKNCKIFPGSVISAIPQDLKFSGEDSFVQIGDHSIIRECVTINRGTSAHGVTSIGSNCLIMAYSHIAHDCIVGDYSVFSNNSTLAGHVKIGKKVKIKFVKDRPGHDLRYALNSNKIKADLRWSSKTKIIEGLNKTFLWYYNNQRYFDNFKKKDITKRLGDN